MRLPFGSTKQWNTWPQQLDGRKHKITPHPLGAHNFATVARCLGNQIIGVGVRVRSILLRCTMSDDEVCGDGGIDAYLEQSDDDSDSCTKASDSCALEEDSVPCALEGQSDGQDIGISVSAVISHIVDDLTPQQSSDTSEDSHVLAPTDDQLPMVTVTNLSSFETPMTTTSYEDSSSIEE
jgi:hypothetical protein